MNNLVKIIQAKQHAEAKKEFKAVMAEKVLNRLEQLKIEVASKLYKSNEINN